jgi:two-component system sensor histidine kinase/response regulator
MNDPQTDPSKEKILIVDDTAHVRQLLSAMLTKRGYEVQVVDSGAEALTTIQESPPDLILLDIMMPDMDGFEVCERLKTDPQTHDIPIIFISALESTEDKVKGFTVGGVDYVTKPFQVKEVLARVVTHLSLRALQKQLQEASREMAVQLDELQARNEELDAFSRAVARDLKAPLTSIIGFADMLKTIHDTMSDDDLEESLQTISANGRKMTKIIDELLLLSGLRQTERVDIQPLDMRSVVSSALKRLADRIEEHQVDVTLPTSWPMALGYAPWVQEVWVNLIGSAIEHGGQPPRVALGATPEADGIIRFWVRSDVHAQASEAQANLPASSGSGQRAQTLDAERGLGMVIVQRIMERLGRKAIVEQTGDDGAVFSFTLREA